jgi:hypothetical protein
MAKIALSEFCRYEFQSEEEGLRAQVLSMENRQWLQNQLSDIAREELNLTYDPQKPMEFMQRDAELKGQRGMIQYLLACSDDALTSLTKLSQGN